MLALGPLNPFDAFQIFSVNFYGKADRMFFYGFAPEDL